VERAMQLGGEEPIIIPMKARYFEVELQPPIPGLNFPGRIEKIIEGLSQPV